MKICKAVVKIQQRLKEIRRRRDCEAMNKGGPGSVEALLRVNNLKKYSTNIETEELTIETCAALGTYRQRQ